MKMKLFVGAALLAIGSVSAHAQYVSGDLIATFENPSGNDVEYNLGLVTSLPTSGTEDFGNVGADLTAAGQSLGAATWSVIGTVGPNDIRGGATTLIQTGLGAITAQPQAIVLTQNDGSTPSFVGSPSAESNATYSAVGTVGVDISTQVTLHDVGSGGGAVVNAAADTASYTNNVPGTEVSNNLQNGLNSSSQLWVLTSQIAGTSGKSGTNEGPFTGAFDIGTFNLSSSGELTFTAIPEPSTYAAILGALTLGVVAIRRRRSAVI
jgi:hypothetical protein